MKKMFFVLVAALFMFVACGDDPQPVVPGGDTEADTAADTDPTDTDTTTDTEPTEPTDPTEPTEPTDPTEPTKPDEPTVTPTKKPDNPVAWTGETVNRYLPYGLICLGIGIGIIVIVIIRRKRDSAS